MKFKDGILTPFVNQEEEEKELEEEVPEEEKEGELE